MDSKRVNEFEKKFEKMCWDYHIDSNSTLDSGYYREFAEEFIDQVIYMENLDCGESCNCKFNLCENCIKLER